VHRIRADQGAVRHNMRMDSSGQVVCTQRARSQLQGWLEGDRGQDPAEKGQPSLQGQPPVMPLGHRATSGGFAPQPDPADRGRAYGQGSLSLPW